MRKNKWQEKANVKKTKLEICENKKMKMKNEQ